MEYLVPEKLKNYPWGYFFSFANRTKKNLEIIEKMSECKDEDKHAYEVTQLVNSLIGLVVFPKETFFDEMLKDENKEMLCLDNENVLNKIVLDINSPNSEYLRSNTYCEHNNNTFYTDRNENIDIFSLVRHIRNAISHKKVYIYPQNSK